MIIGGLQKFSLLDYPKHISAIVFTQGCNFRCPFCYNPMLVCPTLEVGKLKNIFLEKNTKEKEEGHSLIKEDDLFHFLKNRAGKLEAVVITGGEPTIQLDLPEFIKKIKVLGYKIKLDTNGTNPDVLKELIAKKLIDYIAMDIKAPKEKYEKVAGINFNSSLGGLNFKKIAKSVKIIIASNLPYEFRTTIIPGLLNQDDIKEIGKIIEGADKWYLQKFNIEPDLIDNKLKKNINFSEKEIKKMANIGKKFVKECLTR